MNPFQNARAMLLAGAAIFAIHSGAAWAQTVTAPAAAAPCVQNAAAGEFACGNGSSASVPISCLTTAVGINATATGFASQAYGWSANALGTFATSIGAGAGSTGGAIDGMISIGTNANSFSPGGAYSTAIGT